MANKVVEFKLSDKVLLLLAVGFVVAGGALTLMPSSQVAPKVTAAVTGPSQPSVAPSVPANPPVAPSVPSKPPTKAASTSYNVGSTGADTSASSNNYYSSGGSSGGGSGGGSSGGSTYSTVELDVNVVNVTDLAGVQFDLSYNAANLAYMRVSKGAFLDNGSNSSMLLSTMDTNTRGLVKGVVVVRTASSGVSGSGNVVSFFFSSNGGNAGFNMYNVLLSDSNGQAMSTSYIATVSR